MYDWLLFLHVLAAFALAVPTVTFSAFALGAPLSRTALTWGNALWAIGGLGTLIFGVWLAIYVDGYEVWDGWIIAALVLWMLASGAGEQAQRAVEKAADGVPLAAELRRKIAGAHWVRTLFVLALLVVMIYKPGA